MPEDNVKMTLEVDLDDISALELVKGRDVRVRMRAELGRHVGVSYWARANEHDLKDRAVLALENLHAEQVNAREREITQQDYYEQVRALAREALECKHKDGDDIQQWVTETVDSHQWVIYTWANLKVLEHSKNESAYFDNYGALEKVDSFSELTQKLAYAALETDVNEAISAQEDKLTVTYNVALTNIQWDYEKTAAPDKPLPTDLYYRIGEADDNDDAENQAQDMASDEHGYCIETCGTKVTAILTWED